MRCLNSTSAARGHPNPLHPGGPSLYPSGRKQTPGSEMARPRTIDRDAALDAAQRVVARDGAAGLTLEAVAAEAGISKASVLSDYGTKHALMKELIASCLADVDSRIEESDTCPRTD